VAVEAHDVPAGILLQKVARQIAAELIFQLYCPGILPAAQKKYDFSFFPLLTFEKFQI